MLVELAIESIDREFTLRSRVCVFDPEQPLPFRHRLTWVPICHVRWAARSDHMHDRR